MCVAIATQLFIDKVAEKAAEVAVEEISRLDAICTPDRCKSEISAKLCTDVKYQIEVLARMNSHMLPMKEDVFKNVMFDDFSSVKFRFRNTEACKEVPEEQKAECAADGFCSFFGIGCVDNPTEVKWDLKPEGGKILMTKDAEKQPERRKFLKTSSKSLVSSTTEGKIDNKDAMWEEATKMFAGKAFNKADYEEVKKTLRDKYVFEDSDKEKLQKIAGKPGKPKSIFRRFSSSGA
eukprot:g2751.t1